MELLHSIPNGLFQRLIKKNDYEADKNIKKMAGS